MIRRADLIRWNMLKKKLDEAKTKMYDLRSLSGEYDWLTGHLYTKPIDFKWKRNGVEYTLSKKALQFYGLQPGENKLDPSGYVEYTDSEGKTTTWIKEDNLKDDKIESLYLQDPDKYMYWPIFQYNLDANQRWRIIPGMVNNLLNSNHYEEIYNHSNSSRHATDWQRNIYCM